VKTGQKLPMKKGEIPRLGEHQQRTIELAKNLGKSPISYHTFTKVLTNGDETFQSIMEKIKKAKHHIHLQYYIVRDDELGREIKDLLISKSQEGVEVRFLYDAVGCLKLPRTYIDPLRNAGVQMEPFFPVTLPFFNNRVNFRNHRKIIIVDGETGYIGGLNIGDEYLGKNKYFGFWRDTHLRVEGEAVRRLQLYFLRDWYYMTYEKLPEEDRYLKVTMIEEDPLGGVQMIAGGPDDEWNVIKKLFFSMINSAKQSVWIASPYFIPDEDILSALKVVALSGVDVKLLVPARPDKKVVFYASHSYFMELLEAGVKIFSYQKGFMHSKLIIVDEELASIGTSNMDMRSFHLNFEVNCFLYHTDSVTDLVRDYNQDLQGSTQIELEGYRNRKLTMKIKESFARLASPLL
jgi:cardiolipin synthase